MLQLVKLHNSKHLSFILCSGGIRFCSLAFERDLSSLWSGLSEQEAHLDGSPWLLGQMALFSCFLGSVDSQ